MEAATTASDGLRKKKKHDATLAELAGSSAMSSGWVVNIQSLLQHYDPLYFHSLLCPRVTLSWSGSLKSDTGKCLVQSSQEGSGVMLDLSEPILRYCTKDDIIDTLLHEMIHAYLYLSGDPEWQAHGRSFLHLANTINKAEGSNVQPYHKFTREVAFLQLPELSWPSVKPSVICCDPSGSLRQLTSDETRSQLQYITSHSSEATDAHPVQRLECVEETSSPPSPDAHHWAIVHGQG
jgi:hypothetical protein